MKKLFLISLLIAALNIYRTAQAEKTYGPGVTDTEIKLGQTMPYGGPGLGAGRHRQGYARLFRDGQRRRRFTIKKEMRKSMLIQWSPSR